METKTFVFSPYEVIEKGKVGVIAVNKKGVYLLNEDGLIRLLTTELGLDYFYIFEPNFRVHCFIDCKNEYLLLLRSTNSRIVFEGKNYRLLVEIPRIGRRGILIDASNTEWEIDVWKMLRNYRERLVEGREIRRRLLEVLVKKDINYIW